MRLRSNECAGLRRVGGSALAHQPWLEVVETYELSEPMADGPVSHTESLGHLRYSQSQGYHSLSRLGYYAFRSSMTPPC